MSTSNIERIENELNIILNEAYKNILVNNPFKEKEKYPYIYDSILDDADELIRINSELRESGLQNKPWPKNAFIIGSNGTNSYYFIVLSKDENDNIYYISNEEKFNPKKINKYLCYKSYEDFIEVGVFMQNLLNRRKDEIDRNKGLNK